MPFRLVPVVEGDGEVFALPGLFRRLIAELDIGIVMDIRRPIRRSRGTLLREGGIEQAVHLAAIETGARGSIFILLDSEGDCPAQLAPSLLERARSARPDKQISVVLAHREFEAWFLASGSSLKGRCGLNDGIEDHASPENVQNCKGWLERWMPPTAKYSETADQPALAAVFDLAIAKQRSPSFDKFCREFETICREAI